RTGAFRTPAYFNHTLYFVPGFGGLARTYSIDNGAFSTTTGSLSSDWYQFPGATPSVSANGGLNAIIWQINRGDNALEVYDASGYDKLLYSSGDVPGGRDALGSAIKFAVPTVANGVGYEGTAMSLVP